MRMVACLAAMSVATLSVTAASAASFVVTIEKPGVTSSTASFAYSGVETFDGRATGADQTFGTNFGTSGTIKGTYTGVQVDPANLYGSAGGIGNHAVTWSDTGYSLDLTTTQARGINYFGFYLSALDSGNQLAFYKGGNLLYSFTPTDVLALVKGNGAYYGNPDAPFKGEDSGEAFAFLNFYSIDSTFDRVVFSESPQVGGYESDNHTVGFFTSQSGTPVPSGVPEPASWAMFIGGFGLIGAALRARRSSGALAS